MSTTINNARSDRLGLSRSEAWVLHHVLVDCIEAAHDAAEQPPWWALEVIGKLEASGECGPIAVDKLTGRDTLTCFEAWRVRRALQSYAGDEHTPEEDAAAAEGIIDHLDQTFEAPPTALQQ